MALSLPRRISSDEFSYDNPPEGCYVACVMMLLIYWRSRNQSAEWRLPSTPDADEWVVIGRELFEEVSIGGADTNVMKEERIPQLLREHDLTAELGFGERHVIDVIDAAQTMALNEIPTIVFFDSRRLYKGIRSEGSVHSGIFLEEDDETVRLIDPSNLGALGYQVVTREQFEDASSEIPQVLQFFYPKRDIRVLGFRPEASLEKWLPEESP